MRYAERKKGRKDRGDTWWWNKDVQEIIAKKKKAYKEWCKNKSEENKITYRQVKNRTKRVISRAMKEEAEKVWEDLDLHVSPNNIFKVLKFIKNDSKDVEGER